MEKKLIEFWSEYEPYRIHPEDKRFLGDNFDKYCLDLTFANIFEKYGPDLKKDSSHKKFLLNNKSKDKILTNMYVVPFLGDILNSKIYFLMTNPGFHIGDYVDEHKDEEYIELLENNLKLKCDKFLCLDDKASKTGGYKYWSHKSRIPRIALSLKKLANINYPSALNIVLKNLTLIETIPYHSIEKPNNHLLKLPSSQMTLKFVHNHILKKAINNEAIIFVWRGRSFWNLPKHENIIVRSVSQNSFIYEDEATLFSNFLKKFI